MYIESLTVTIESRKTPLEPRLRRLFFTLQGANILELFNRHSVKSLHLDECGVSINIYWSNIDKITKKKGYLKLKPFNSLFTPKLKDV